jgi:hypothetical protein
MVGGRYAFLINVGHVTVGSAPLPPPHLPHTPSASREITALHCSDELKILPVWPHLRAARGLRKAKSTKKLALLFIDLFNRFNLY